MAFARVAAPCRILAWGIIDMQTSASRQCTDRMFALLQDGELAYIRNERIPVVVEAQPADGACKVLTHGMQMFFLKESERYEYEHRFVMMAPNNKLKLVQAYYESMPRTTRAQRKAIAMRTTESLLAMDERDARFRDFYHRHEYKQQTDLADALTQAVRFLQLFNAETQAYLVANPPERYDPWLTPARERKFRQMQARAAHPDEFGRSFRARSNRAPTEDDSPVEQSDVIAFADE